MKSGLTTRGGQKRVAALVVARLEALSAKQAERQARAPRTAGAWARAEQRRVKHAGVFARAEAARARMKDAERADLLLSVLCMGAVLRKRRSLRRGPGDTAALVMHRLLPAAKERTGTAPGHPLPETKALCRAYDRARTLLHRLVRRWAVAEAAREAHADAR